jgi:hypothetical protein
MLSVIMLIDAECHYAGCHYAECHYAECHYAECHYAECHYAECRYAECHGTENRSVKVDQSPKFVILDNFFQGILIEGDGLVQLTSTLRYLVS